MAFRILGHGHALPAHSVTLAESVEYGRRISCQTDEQRRLLPALYRHAGVKRRYSVLLEAPAGAETRQSFFSMPESPEDRGPGVEARMVRYAAEAGPLATRAAANALADSGCAPGEITHLVTVSCSGFAAPGVDIDLIEGLNLSPGVERVHVGFMGCHGALNGLRAARGLAAADPGSRVLLCAVELCSLHYHYGWDPEQIVANALFADGAAAVVGGVGEGPWRVAATGSRLIPGSRNAMSWSIAGHGFVMTLAAETPGLIAEHLGPWLTEWLGAQGLAVEDVATWAVHPGGPRILSAAGKALGLGPGALEVSRTVLRDYGNMSSPTVLFILEACRREGRSLPCVALAFGPGLMAEAVLFTE